MPRCNETVQGVPDRFYTDMNGRVTPFPVSLLVHVRHMLNLHCTRKLTSSKVE